MAQAPQRLGLCDTSAPRASVHPQALGAEIETRGFPLSSSTEVCAGGGGRTAWPREMPRGRGGWYKERHRSAGPWECNPECSLQIPAQHDS